jgi:hypothetical protein
VFVYLYLILSIVHYIDGVRQVEIREEKGENWNMLGLNLKSNSCKSKIEYINDTLIVY